VLGTPGVHAAVPDATPAAAIAAAEAAPLRAQADAVAAAAAAAAKEKVASQQVSIPATQTPSPPGLQQHGGQTQQELAAGCVQQAGSDSLAQAHAEQQQQQEQPQEEEEEAQGWGRLVYSADVAALEVDPTQCSTRAGAPAAAAATEKAAAAAAAATEAAPAAVAVAAHQQAPVSGTVQAAPAAEVDGSAAAAEEAGGEPCAGAGDAAVGGGWGDMSALEVEPSQHWAPGALHHRSSRSRYSCLGDLSLFQQQQQQQQQQREEVEVQAAPGVGCKRPFAACTTTAAEVNGNAASGEGSGPPTKQQAVCTPQVTLGDPTVPALPLLAGAIQRQPQPRQPQPQQVDAPVALQDAIRRLSGAVEELLLLPAPGPGPAAGQVWSSLQQLMSWLGQGMQAAPAGSLQGQPRL
jgi:hypothetical protein